jgi:dihydroxy-acid dehydratase
VLVNLKPVGQYYMEDFHAAGGMPALLRELKPLLNLNCCTVTGETLGEQLAPPGKFVDRNVIHSADDPIRRSGGLLALFGNIAPNGALLKCAAADERLFEHVGRAVVFKDLNDLAARIDDPGLEVSPASVLVLQNAGSVAAGMPEAGYLPIPAKLARAGVKDMVRISDARMSGTAFGTIILHVSPESAKGGPLGLIRTGDEIRLSVREWRTMLWFPNRILKTGGGRQGPSAELRAAMPNSMRIPFSARSSAAILISCGKTAFESKDESLRFWHSDARVPPLQK